MLGLGERGLHRWLLPYLLTPGRRRLPRPDEPVHVLLAVCDHYEPKRGGVTMDKARARVRQWVDDYPRLFDRFRDIVVSGDEGLIKPDRAIFDLLCTRNGLDPAQCLFIDDSLKNVKGAEAAGWQACHFTTPETLRRELDSRRLL